MSVRIRVLWGLVVCAVLLTIGPALAKLPSIPGIPGVPSVPSAKQAAKGVVSNELLKEFGAWFNLNRPVYVSGNDVLPTVKNLPGGTFHPATQAVTQTLFSHAHNGVLQMPPGDYNMSVVTYCMGHHLQGPWRNKFMLAPIKGAWADVVVALNYRAAGSRFTPPQVQVLSWTLQAGMNYAEMNSDSKQIVDTLLPEFKPRLQGDFYDRARDEWNTISSKAISTSSARYVPDRVTLYFRGKPLPYGRGSVPSRERQRPVHRSHRISRRPGGLPGLPYKFCGISDIGKTEIACTFSTS